MIIVLSVIVAGSLIVAIACIEMARQEDNRAEKNQDPGGDE